MRKWQQCGAVVAVGLGVACSDEGGRSRDEEMVATAPVGPAPSGSYGTTSVGTPGNSGAAPAPAGGGVAAPGADGATMGTPPLADPGTLNGMTLGAPLEFVTGTGMVPYAIGPNAYGIQGGGFIAQSRLGNMITIGTDPGKICIRGNLEEVPLNPDGHGNYSQYWGVEVGFNLNEAPDGSGSESATPMNVSLPWQPGNVVGFSFVIEGPTINLIRFKTLPAGADASLEANVYCKEIHATSGAANRVLLGELSTYCWSGTSSIVPLGAGLANISWQLPADVAPAGARPFDWCLSDLRPILTQQ